MLQTNITCLKMAWWMICVINLNVHILFAMDLGISTRFSDVIIDNLQPGRTYNLTEIKNLPLTIINTSSEEKEIQIEVERPEPGELKPGYEPIEDPNWIKIIPDRFKLAPGARNLSDVIINIPNDKKLIGKHYQAMFWSHTLDTGFLGVGVKVRFRYSIASRSPEVVKAEIQKKKMLDLNFRLDPISVTASEFPLGKKVDLKDKNLAIKLVNTGSTRLKLKIESASYLEPQRPPQGFEPLPDLKWLEVDPKIMDSKPDTIIPLKVRINIPDKPEYKDKKYAGLIQVTLVGQEIPLNVYSQVLISTMK